MLHILHRDMGWVVMNQKKFKVSGLYESNTFIMLCVLVVVIVVFFILNPNFISRGNLVNILVASSTIGFLAIGQTYLIIAGHIDLSCGTAAERCRTAFWPGLF